MTVRLDLKPEIHASLIAQAQARGLSVEAYLEQMIQERTIDTPSLSLDEWEFEFESWVNSFPDTPALSDDAISRESMYPDRH